MSEVTIRTNNRWRDPIYWDDLKPKERKEFDYLDNEDDQLAASFIRYRGWIYDLGEFTRLQTTPTYPSPMDKWQGYHGDSYFSGIVIRWNSHYDAVQIGTYTS